ncbi:MAG TPA: TIGR03668 family PPOX class F420-dependent oxidoreductase [Streptosporangiaceae bacterium]|nr:TIGR03668 family PPOX class F420-dependent oxidoreductase [Streptosporangiaceae bacterium]
MRMGVPAARRRFAGAAVARLATVGPDGRPHVVPVTFVLDSAQGHGDRIYTAVDAKPKTTTRLQRLRNIRADPRVSVLADHYEPDWDGLWWVRADTRGSVLDEPAAMAPAVLLLAGRYPQYRQQPPGGPVICVQVERWTGWAAAAG